MAIRPKRIRLNHVFKNKEWTIISITEDDFRYKVEAKRPRVKNQLNHFIGYGGREYAEKLAKLHYGVDILEVVRVNEWV